MIRNKDEKVLKDKYDAVDDESFLTDKQKRTQKKLWKKKMTKLSRKKNQKIEDDELEKYGGEDDEL